MSYLIRTLKAPGSRAARASSTVFNPLSAQRVSPTPTPDYGQKIGSFMAGLTVPQFAGGTANADNATGRFTFSNAATGAYGGGVSAPNIPSSAPGVGGVGSIDWQNDPIYQQAQAAVQAQIAQAEAQSLAAEKQNLIRYGDANLVAQVLGGKADQQTLDAARNNSFSTVAELGRWNTRALGGIDSSTNRNNLYYSSTRLRDRGLQSEDYVRQQTRTANQLQDVLTGIANGLMQARTQGQMELVSAAEGAYNRGLQLALMQQYQQQPAGGASPLATAAGAGSGAGGLAAPPIVTGHGGGGFIPPGPFTYKPPVQSPYLWWQQQQQPGWGRP